MLSNFVKRTFCCSGRIVFLLLVVLSGYGSVVFFCEVSLTLGFAAFEDKKMIHLCGHVLSAIKIFQTYLHKLMLTCMACNNSILESKHRGLN